MNLRLPANDECNDGVSRDEGSFDPDMRRPLAMSHILTNLGQSRTLNLSQFIREKLVLDASRLSLFLLCAASIILSLLLGGGTRSGFLSDALLQIFTIPLLIVALSRIFDLTSHQAVLSPQLACALAFCAAVVLVPLMQLIPLPPWIWTALPGRKPETEVFDLLGWELPWMPISVSPYATWQSAMSIIPTSAVFIGTLLLGYRERRLLSIVVLAFGVFSVFVGLMQVAQGEASSLRFFEFTNPTEAVGFFANRNHFAALLYVLTLFAAAWAVQAASTAGSWWGRRNYQAAAIVPIVTSFTILVVLVSAQAMARSRAGLALTMIALFGAFALAYDDRRSASRGAASRLLAVTATLAVLLSVQFALYRIMERFDSDPLQDARIPIARNTIEAAKAFLPLGAGVGTFAQVYGIYEKPKDTLINSYVNHAHDDVLEVLLETGIPGAILMFLFVAAWGFQCAELWRRGPAEGAEVDLALARAASIVVGLLMVHSFVDYPLRTGGMMAILAFTCALLSDPPESEVRREADIARKRRVIVQAADPSSTPSRPTALSTSKEKSFHRPQTIDWPEEWRDAGSPGASDNAPPKSDKSVND